MGRHNDQLGGSPDLDYIHRTLYPEIPRSPTEGESLTRHE